LTVKKKNVEWKDAKKERKKGMEKAERQVSQMERAAVKMRERILIKMVAYTEAETESSGSSFWFSISADNGERCRCGRTLSLQKIWLAASFS
jgi:hypothetical protein